MVKVNNMAQNSARGGSITAEVNGPQLVALRGDLKQRDIEEACDITRGHLSRSETGKPVGIKYIIKLANYHGVPPRVLLTEQGFKNSCELLIELAQLTGATVKFDTNGEATV